MVVHRTNLSSIKLTQRYEEPAAVTAQASDRL